MQDLHLSGQIRDAMQAERERKELEASNSNLTLAIRNRIRTTDNSLAGIGAAVSEQIKPEQEYASMPSQNAHNVARLSINSSAPRNTVKPVEIKTVPSAPQYEQQVSSETAYAYPQPSSAEMAQNTTANPPTQYAYVEQGTAASVQAPVENVEDAITPMQALTPEQAHAEYVDAVLSSTSEAETTDYNALARDEHNKQYSTIVNARIAVENAFPSDASLQGTQVRSGNNQNFDMESGLGLTSVGRF